ncbi:MAG: MtrB/PioB family outer membrane beta-barrel protein, partial [Usitatibacteraceae bacterium]
MKTKRIDYLHFSGTTRSATSSPCVKLLSLLVALIVAPLASTVARADSGAGVDSSIGNALNPAGTASAREKDPEGLGIQEFTRSPTGLLVSRPTLPLIFTNDETGWLRTGTIELGGISVKGGTREAKFLEYKDLRNGVTVNNFHGQMENRESAMFVEALGGSLGLHDQYSGLSFGRYNDWKVKSFYNETPHVFTSSYRSLWSGIGTSNLTLDSLRPGGTTTPSATDINIGNAALATPFSTLSISRKRGGLRADMKFREN